MKKKFCCEASRGMYEDYYNRQTGGEIPVFAGARRQRGHGLGSILSGLFRKIVPFIKSNVKNVGRNLLRTGVDIAGDVLGGRRLKESAQQRIPQGLKRTSEDLDWKSTHPIVRTVGSNLVKTGANIAGDLIAGKKFKTAAREHVPKGIKTTVHSFGRQTGSGRRRRRGQNRKDIFG